MTTPADQTPLLPPDETTRGHARAAAWTVGGLFRYDEHLLTMVSFLAAYYPARAVSRVAGSPPCAWTLEEQGRLRPVLEDWRFDMVLRSFAGERVGVVLVFDNPAPEVESLEDEYAHGLVRRLLSTEFNPTQRNAVCVASDALAARLRADYPRLPIICHPNRLLAGTEKRTPEFYESLEKTYSLVTLHPRDAVNPALFSRLKHVGRYLAVVNDPSPRNDATRRDRLRTMAELHRRPWDSSLRRALSRMQQQVAADAASPTCNLTCDEETALYEAGVRSFVVQASLHRNELTLWYDLFYHMLRTDPEHSNKAALVASAALAHIRPLEDELPSGLGLFSTFD